MNWIRSLIDRWRRGPELRAAHALANAQHVALQEVTKRLEGELDAVRHRLGHAHAVVSAWVDLSRRVRAVCDRCGSTAWGGQWRPNVSQDVAGRLFFAPICRSCDDRASREAAKSGGAQQAAAGPIAPAPLTVPS
jgi:hypothetical protein